ncbi:MAG TPA: hypothetical protein VGJ73_09520 [Verrucomicrobiae bacterium]|jgi:hypothetical protein
MSRFGKFVAVASVMWFPVYTVYAVHRRSGVMQLFSMAITLLFFTALVISIVCIFSEWRQRRWLSFLPFAVCVLTIVISSVIVRAIREAIFVRSLPGYEAVVKKMESGTILVSTNLSTVPQAVPLAPLAYAVLAQKDATGALTVEFLTEGGFPLKHSGYLYVSSGVIPPGSLEDSRWPIRKQERGKWFFISD